MISTLGGLFNLNHFDQSSRANDVIVIRHKDGTLHSTPFNVRFGRAQIWRNQGRVVQVEVNGELTTAVMKIGKGGEAYWLQPTYGSFGEAAHHSSAGGACHTEQRTPGAAAPARHPTTTGGHGRDRGAGAGTAGGNGVMSDESAGVLQSAGSLGSMVKGAETLSIDDAELQRLPIRPESPPAAPAAPAAAGAAGLSSTPPPRRSPAPAEPASSPVLPGPPDSIACGSAAAVREGRGAGTEPHMDRHAGSQDSVADMPLLHTADDGHLTVETRAIHSAGDAQEARLALRAMAAAEKSRKRLWRMGLAGDAYLLKSAQEEGQIGDDEDDGEEPEELANGDGGGEAEQAVHARGTVSPPAAAAAATATVTATAAAEADGVGGEQEKPATSTLPPAASRATAAPPPAPAPAAGPSSQPASPSRPPPPADPARPPSSAASATGSTDSYKVEEEDTYFLDALEADDDYAAGLYGADEENLLGEASFASSVTSGVSLPDPMAKLSYGCGSADSSSGVASLSGAGKAGRGGDAAVAVPPTTTPPSGPTRLLRPMSLPSPSSPLKAPVEERRTGKAGKEVGDAAAKAAPPTSSRSGFSGASGSFGSTDEVVDAEGRVVQLPPSTGVGVGVGGGGPYFTRTLIPAEADLWKLGLREGCNAVRYLARKDKGDIVAVCCNIFLWNWTDRLVVSDVDGTITKSDLLGHFYAMLGKGADWTHPGICNLYSKIEGNGYRMVYLTARSVSQINQTKTYLFTLQQDGVRLPMGPVLTAPQRFFTALTQEVSKQSHVFKIACLTSVRAAFPPTTKPFFAGFGNRYNDVISYDAAGISTHKIFIIDPSSVLHVCLVRQTYRDLGHLVDVTFPPVKRHMFVLRAPRHLQRTDEAAAAVAGRRAFGGAGGNSGGGGRRPGVDRHSYTRGLLHRSASASSSSASSVSSLTSDSSDIGEYVSGVASEEGSPGSPPMPAAVGGGRHLPRPSSAAFSLVNLVRVEVGDAGAAGRGGDGGAGGTLEPAAPSDAAVPTAVAAGAQCGAAALPPTSSATQQQQQQQQAAAAPSPPGAGSKPELAPVSTRRPNIRSRRATFSDLNDDDDDEHYRRGIGGGAVHDKEEVPADPEFSSFAYWRMDPRDLIASSPANTTSKADDKKMLPAVASANLTTTTTTSGGGGASLPPPNTGLAAASQTSAHTPERSPAHGPVGSTAALPITPIPTAVAKASAPGSSSGTAIPGSATALVGAGKAEDGGAAAGSAEGVAGGGGVGAGVAGSKIVLPQPVPGPQDPPPPPPRMQTAALLPSVGAGKDKPVSATAGGAAAAATSEKGSSGISISNNNNISGGGGGGGGRSFFAAFSFSRARPVEVPPSPHTQRAAQLHEEAKRRALAHPDARQYYAAPTPVAPPPPSGGGGGGLRPVAGPTGPSTEPVPPTP